MAIEQAGRTRTAVTTAGAGAPMVTAAGPDPDRILLVADDVLLLAGATHEAGLTGELARSLAGRTARGTVVEAVTRPGLRLPDVAALLPSVRLERFDAVVLVTAGDPDGSVSAWRRDLTALLHVLEDGCCRDTAVLVVGTPAHAAPGLRDRLAARHGRHLLDAARAVAEAWPHGRYLSLDRDQERGDGIAAALAPVLATAASAPTSGRTVRAAEDETARLRALAATGLARAGRDERFASIAEQAKVLLGGETAVIGFIDSDTHWISAIAGGDAEQLPRSISFCDSTIRSESPFVVGDLAADERFASNPMVVGEPKMRFYAGYPIESVDGYRIGSICVLGGTPRDPSSVDVAALQTLAHAARTQIWELADAKG